MITSETATSLTLTRAEGQSDTVLRTEVDELVNTGKSIMPEGLERELSKQDLADVIEYLMTVP
jgi:putative heme-binding domain-containing protein